MEQYFIHLFSYSGAAKPNNEFIHLFIFLLQHTQWQEKSSQGEVRWFLCCCLCWFCDPSLKNSTGLLPRKPRKPILAACQKMFLVLMANSNVNKSTLRTLSTSDTFESMVRTSHLPLKTLMGRTNQYRTYSVWRNEKYTSNTTKKQDHLNHHPNPLNPTWSCSWETEQLMF